MNKRRTIFMDFGLLELINQPLCAYLLEAVQKIVWQGDPTQHYVFVFDVWTIPRDVAARRMIYTTLGDVMCIGKLWLPLSPKELPGADEAFWFSARETRPSPCRMASAKYPRIQAIARKVSISADGGLETMSDEALKMKLVESLKACAEDCDELVVDLSNLDKSDFAEWPDAVEEAR